MVDGQSDPALSDQGERQAAAAASRLAREEVTALFVTPLRRTARTAGPLALALALRPVVVPSLREIHLGAIENDLGTPDRRRAALREILAQGRWDIDEGGEPAAGFAARVAAGLAQVADSVGPTGRAVVFTHGGVIAEACRQATGSLPLAFVARLRHASLTRLHYGFGRTTLVGFNDVAHLDER